MREIKRSQIREAVLDEHFQGARVLLVKPRDVKAFTETIDSMMATVERELKSTGYIIINDEDKSCEEAVPNPIPLVRLGNFPYHRDIMPEDIK